MALPSSSHGRYDRSHVGFVGKLPAARCARTGNDGLRTSPSVTAGAGELRADGFSAWVLRRAGLDPAAYRPEPLLRRVPACLRALKVSSTRAAQGLLERQPQQLSFALSALLIGVTGLFREPAVFESLRTQILPAWAQQRGALRIWSAACSTGQELYGMAILLAEAGLLERSFLLGTDCRRDAIAAAEDAHYSDVDLGPFGLAWRDRYFQSARRGWRPIDALRRQIRWKVADLLREVEAGPWDMILWRNVAIYLAPQHAETIWRQLAAELAPGGVLVVGKAERPPTGVKLYHLSRCLYGAGTTGHEQPSSVPSYCATECLRRLA